MNLENGYRVKPHLTDHEKRKDHQLVMMNIMQILKSANSKKHSMDNRIVVLKAKDSNHIFDNLKDDKFDLIKVMVISMIRGNS